MKEEERREMTEDRGREKKGRGNKVEEERRRGKKTNK